MKEEINASVGDTVFYRLKLSDLPINPERVWKGNKNKACIQALFLFPH